MRSISIAFCSLCFLINVNAQTIEFGIGGGLTLYSGDLDSPSLITNATNNSRFAFNAFGRYNMNTHFSVRFNYMRSKLAGDDSISDAVWQVERNLSFESDISEVSLLLEYNLFDIISDDTDKRWTIYGTVGIASLRHNPTTVFEDRVIELQPLGTEGQGLPGFGDPYSLQIFTIPFGGGLKFKINETFTIQTELVSRYTFFDYLDDVSTSYVGVEDLVQNGQLATMLGNRSEDPVSTGDQRGTPDVNDYYSTGTISLVVKFGNMATYGRGNIGCPTNF